MNATALGNDKNSASTNSNPHNLQGGSRWFSQNVFQEGPKMVKFGFYPSKLKKQTFLLIISQSRGSKVSLSPLATPMANMKDDVMPSSPITKSSFFSLWTSQRCRSFTAWRQLTKVSVNLWDIIHYSVNLWDIHYWICGTSFIIAITDKAFIWERHIFKIFICCSLCSDLYSFSLELLCIFCSSLVFHRLTKIYCNFRAFNGFFSIRMT